MIKTLNNFVNENNNSYNIEIKLNILKSYIHILINGGEDKFSLAVNYFRIIHNFLVIERMFYDDVVLAGKEINKYLQLERFDNYADVYRTFLELYDNEKSIIRTNVETFDNIDTIKEYITNNRYKVFNTLI